MSIKYHQYGLGYEYGEDHALTNNWNPDEDYGNEYSNVYFNIDTPAYDGMNGNWKVDERETIGKEIDRLFTSLGWKCNKPEFNGVCATYTKGKSTHLNENVFAFSIASATDLISFFNTSPL